MPEVLSRSREYSIPGAAFRGPESGAAEPFETWERRWPRGVWSMVEWVRLLMNDRPLR